MCLLPRSCVGLLFLFLYGGFSVFAQAPKVGINTRTPQYTLDVKGDMRVAEFENTKKISTHLLAVDKNTHQVVRTPIATAGPVRVISRVLTFPPTEYRPTKTYTFTTKEIDPNKEEAILLQANLKVNNGAIQSHHQKLLSVIDYPEADSKYALMPAELAYTGTNPRDFLRSWIWSNGRESENYDIAFYMGKKSNGNLRLNSLLFSSKQVTLELDKRQNRYVFYGSYGIVPIEHTQGSRLQWEVIVLVIDKLWASKRKQVLRVDRNGRLTEMNRKPYNPIYRQQTPTPPSPPQVKPLYAQATRLAGRGEPGAEIRVSTQGGAPVQPVTVNEVGEWSVPVSGVNEGKIYTVVQSLTRPGQQPNRQTVQVVARAAQTHDWVSIGRRDARAALDVKGTWGLHTLPHWSGEEATALAVDGSNVDLAITKLKEGRRVMYALTFDLGNPDSDYIKEFTIRKLSSDFILVPTRVSFSKTIQKNGRWVSFDKNRVDHSGAYLEVSVFSTFNYDQVTPGHRTAHALCTKDSRFKLIPDKDWFAGGTMKDIVRDERVQGRKERYHIGALVGPIQSLISSKEGSTSYSEFRMHDPLKLDFHGVTAMARNTPHAWRVTYLAIRKDWLGSPR